MDSADPQQLTPVVTTASAKHCRELALVLQAVSIDHQVVRGGAEFTILVPVDEAEHALRELRAYQSEREAPPADPVELPVHPRAWLGVMVYAIVLLLVAGLAWGEVLGVDWNLIGRTDAALIRAGQWWRAATALTLHASPAHLLGNVVIGGLVGYFAGQMLGAGLAWSCIVVGGVAGNLINAWARPNDHFSIGASTAVFAALGLLAAVAQTGRTRAHHSALLRFAPLIGATVLLAFLGTGSERTDVGAHVFGFLAGLGVGALFGTGQDTLVRRSRLQLGLGIMALALIVTAWVVALARALRTG